MSKSEEVIRTLEEIRHSADALVDAVGCLEALLKEQPKKEDPVLKLEDVRAVLAEKSRSGFTARVRELLQKYGADKLSAVKPEHYKALLKDVEGIGNAD